MNLDDLAGLGALAHDHPEYNSLIDEIVASDTVAVGFERMSTLLQRVMNDHLKTSGPPSDDVEAGVQFGFSLAAMLIEAAAGAFARRDAT